MYYYLFDQSRNQYITSAIPLRRAAGYAVYYGDKPIGCRWATEKGARGRLDLLVKTGSLPADHAVKVVGIA